MNHTISTPARPVSTGSPFGQALKTFFQASHLPPAVIAEALAYIDAHGTATGSVVPVEHQAEANQVIRDKTGAIEYESAEDFPAAWDELAWGTTDAPLPPRGTVPEVECNGDNVTIESTPSPDPWASAPTVPASAVPSWAEPFCRDYEPSHAERVWVASEGRVNLFDADVDRRADEAWAAALLEAGLIHAPAPICGGSPADDKPVKVSADRANAAARARHLRGVSGITDEDHRVVTGCV